MLDAASWLALGVALSPTLLDLAGHWQRVGFARPAALFALLAAAYCLVERRAPPLPRPGGWLVVAAAVALSVATTAGGVVRAGRPAVPIAVLGLAQALGTPALPRAALALFAVPVPDAVTRSLPGLHLLPAAVASLAGEPPSAPPLPGAEAPDELHPSDGGLPLAWILAGFGWCAALGARGDARTLVAGALRAALLALPVQAAGIALALALLAASGAGAARAWLDAGLPLAAALAGVLLLDRRARAARARA